LPSLRLLPGYPQWLFRSLRVCGAYLAQSTLADQVGGCTAALAPLFKRLEAYVLSAERLHGDDTTVPVLAKGKTDTGRIWVYVRDDKPFGGQAPPGAVFYYSRDRAGEHPQAHLANYTGILQADAYGGYRKLYESGRAPGPILEAASWVHARRPFFVMADLAENARRKAEGKKPAVISPLALEAVRRIDALFEIERAINGQSAERRKAVRQQRMRVVALDLPTSWMMATNAADEFTGRMFEAINGMMLDMLAAVARKDYDDRRRRQAQGQAKAKAEGRYKGRPEDAERNDGIARMLDAGQSWGSIQRATGCSRATIAKIAKRFKQQAA
jgi:DNA invertase Pin-like site-specific DNA recombinase